MHQEKMELNHTKRVLNQLVDENRKSEYGRPIPDSEFKRVKEEIEDFERSYKLMKLSLIAIVVISISYVIVKI